MAGNEFDAAELVPKIDGLSVFDSLEPATVQGSENLRALNDALAEWGEKVERVNRSIQNLKLVQQSYTEARNLTNRNRLGVYWDQVADNVGRASKSLGAVSEALKAVDAGLPQDQRQGLGDQIDEAGRQMAQLLAESKLAKELISGVAAEHKKSPNELQYLAQPEKLRRRFPEPLAAPQIRESAEWLKKTKLPRKSRDQALTTLDRTVKEFKDPHDEYERVRSQYKETFDTFVRAIRANVADTKARGAFEVYWNTLQTKFYKVESGFEAIRAAFEAREKTVSGTDIRDDNGAVAALKAQLNAGAPVIKQMREQVDNVVKLLDPDLKLDGFNPSWNTVPKHPLQRADSPHATPNAFPSPPLQSRRPRAHTREEERIIKIKHQGMTFI